MCRKQNVYTIIVAITWIKYIKNAFCNSANGVLKKLAQNAKLRLCLHYVHISRCYGDGGDMDGESQSDGSYYRNREIHHDFLLPEELITVRGGWLDGRTRGDRISLRHTLSCMKI